MIEFFNKLFGRQPSGATAKERLRLVLMSDHLSLAPDMIEAMKRDLVDVISRYVEVDREKIDVHFEHQDKALAMLANIPITGVNRNGSNGNGSNGPGGTKVEAALATPEIVAAPQAVATPLCDPEPVDCHPEPVDCHPEPVEGRSVAEAATTSTPKRTPRRKRKRPSGGGAAPGSTAPGSTAPAT